MKKRKLGEVLRDQGKITSEDLLTAIADQQGKMIHLGELMLERCLVGKDDLVAALEEVAHVPYLDCSTIVPEPEAIKLIQHAVAERCCALPIRFEQKYLIVAMAAPQDLAILDELQFTSGREISPRMAFRAEVQKAIAQFYGVEEGCPAANASSRGDENVRIEELNSFLKAPGNPIKKPLKKCKGICDKGKLLQSG